MTTETEYQQVNEAQRRALNELCTLAHETSVKKGWWIEGDRNKGELIALMHSELSEALEALRHGNPPDDKIPNHKGDAAEMADTVVRILDYCGAYGIKLGDVISDKHAFNCTRTARHGGKAF